MRPPSPATEQTRGDDDAGEATLRDGSGAAPSQPQEEAAFGRYTIEKELGRGGMGIVYRGFDPDLGRPVALKVLLRSPSDIDVARLTREAQAVARLSHPNVVSIFDVGSSRGRVYIVMEFLEGMTLSAWLRRRPTWRSVVKVFLQAGRGLAAAHAAGLIHRDFKPANVMVESSGSVKVLDFGIAREEGDSNDTGGGAAAFLASGLETLTATGIAMGTPPYMSPEQHRGERPSPATDIYAFGVALYRGLYGELPFSAPDTVALVRDKERGLPPGPPDSRVPARLYAIVRRAVAHDPAERFTTMDDLLRALRRAAKRRRAAWGAIAVACIGLVGAVGLFLRKPAPSPSSPREQPIAASRRDGDPEVWRLIERSELLRELDREPEALGIAFAAWPAAIASGSTEALGEARLAVGLTLSRLQWKSQAEPHLRAAREILLSARAGRSALRSATELVIVLDYLERDDEALEEARAAEMLLVRFGLDKDPRAQVDLLLARAAALSGRAPEEALELLEQARIQQQEHLEVFTPAQIARTLQNLSLLVRRTDPQRALDLAEEGLDLVLSAEDEGTRRALQSHSIVAAAESGIGNHARSLEINLNNFFRAPDYLIQYRSREAAEISQSTRLLGHIEEALGWSDVAIELARSDPATVEIDIAILHGSRAAIYNGLGRLADAETQLQAMLVLLESTGSQDPSNLQTVLHNLGEIIRGQGEPERAEPYAIRALELARSAKLGENAIHEAQITLGSILLERGQPKAALEFLGEWVEDAQPMSRVRRRLFARAKGYRAKALWESDESRAAALRLAREAAKETANDPEGLGLHRELEAWLRDHAEARPAGR